jgi:hypothetical protein
LSQSSGALAWLARIQVSSAFTLAKDFVRFASGVTVAKLNRP